MNPAPGRRPRGGAHRHQGRRLLGCVVGIAAGMGVALASAGPAVSPFLLASLGGSAVFLFALTSAPAAQPRALFGAHLGAALIGIACYRCFGDALWVYCLAQALTLVYMLVTRSVHPPAGANPLIMIHSHAALADLWQPVFVGVFSLAAVAFVWSRLVPGLKHYPNAWLAESPASFPGDAWEDELAAEVGDLTAAPTLAERSSP